MIHYVFKHVLIIPLYVSCFQEASLRALKLTGGRFEAALDFLAKQQQNEAVNGLTKVPSSGKYNSTHIYIWQY